MAQYLGDCAAEGSAAAAREKTVRFGITTCAQGIGKAVLRSLGLSALPNCHRFSPLSQQSLLPRRRLSRAASMGAHLALLMACLPAAAALAQPLADPTRPPRTGDLATPAAGPAATLGVLQSVMIADSMREAIISGRVVHVGDRHDDARVLKITEGEVVLRTAEGLQTLKLYPGIETRHMDGRLPAASISPKPSKSK